MKAVAVFNMAQITAMDLLSTVDANPAQSPETRAASLPDYLKDSAPPPPFDPSERATLAAQRAEAALWEKITKGLPSCGNCNELVDQAVKIFW
jgi:hypothetical protein